MRDIRAVIDAILREIPAHEKALWSELTGIRENAAYRAPEVMYLSWEEVSVCLENFLGSILLPDWQVAIVDIWTGKTPIEPTN